MRPIILSGHTRPLTKVKFNADGDLLFTASKDSSPFVWYSHNGERLGSFEGHSGSVWSLDISHDSKLLASGSGDNTFNLWDVATGTMLSSVDTLNAARCVAFNVGSSRVLVVTDSTMGYPCRLLVYSVEDALKTGLSTTVPGHTHRMTTIAESFKITVTGSKATCAIWADLNQSIITGHEDGSICKWDAKTGEKILSVNDHCAFVTDIQDSKDKTHFIVSSKDFTSRLYDTESLKSIKVYETQRPVNSASISPLRDEVILGGGQEALQVTTTAGKSGKFEVRFFHEVFQDEIGRVKGHFGPINTLAYHPSGKGFASGSEDGYVRIHFFDPDYFEFAYTRPIYAAAISS